jgi:hypothetical protein
MEILEQTEEPSQAFQLQMLMEQYLNQNQLRLLPPFLDVNQNGTFDKGEKKVLLSSIKVPGAKAIISKKDKIIRILDLNAFVSYIIEFSDTSLDYISWRFKKKTYQVMVDPNQYKRVFIPIITVGEISSTVF